MSLLTARVAFGSSWCGHSPTNRTYRVLLTMWPVDGKLSMASRTHPGHLSCWRGCGLMLCGVVGAQ